MAVATQSAQVLSGIIQVVAVDVVDLKGKGCATPLSEPTLQTLSELISNNSITTHIESKFFKRL